MTAGADKVVTLRYSGKISIFRCNVRGVLVEFAVLRNIKFHLSYLFYWIVALQLDLNSCS